MANTDNKNGSVSNLYGKDVMQHLEAIYQILGVTDISELDSETIKQKIEALKPDERIWIGTQAQYDEDWGSGKIPADTKCFVF